MIGNVARKNLNGVSGYSGYSGAAGPQGSSGYSGYSGRGINIRGNWAIAMAYAVGDVVYSGGNSYVCYTLHTSAANSEPPNGDDAGFYWYTFTTGSSGYSGYSGATGATGAAGAQGTSGYSGYSGISGATGATGAAGANGATGAQGTSGYSGYSGVVGATGSTGSQGTSGYSGYSGISGANGSGDMTLASTQTNSGAKTFNDATLLLRNPANTYSTTLKAGAITANRTITLPATNTTVAGLATNNTWTGTQDFQGSFTVSGSAGIIVSNGDIELTTGIMLQTQIYVKEAANGFMGTATLSGGTATVSHTNVDASSRIFLCCQTPGGTPGFLRVSARTANTSFTITSSSGSDTSTVAWIIFTPY